MITLTSISQLANAQKEAYEKQWFIKGSDTLPYRLLLPKDYDPQKRYPLVLFLHGSGERGSDNEAQLTHGWMLFLQDSIRNRYPALVVFPQCPAASYWSNMQAVFDTATKKKNIRLSRRRRTHSCHENAYSAGR